MYTIFTLRIQSNNVNWHCGMLLAQRIGIQMKQKSSPKKRALRCTAAIPARKNQTQGDRVRAAIEMDIVSGRFLPGAKLDEKTLSERYGASRTPVREALKHLASEGLVELRPHASAYVARHTVTELAEMFETMAFLESACAALASRRHSADDRVALNAAHQACARASRRKNPDHFYTANKQFHEAIYAASRNRYLESQTISLRNRLEAYRRAATFHAGLIAATMAEHEKILEAILRMDEAAAAALMRSHLDTLQNDAVSMANALAQISAAA